MENPTTFTSVLTVAIKAAQAASVAQNHDVKVLLAEYQICGYLASRQPVDITIKCLDDICETVMKMMESMSKARNELTDVMQKMVEEGVSFSYACSLKIYVP